MSVTSVAFSLSADEDCLLLPSTPRQPWSPEQRRSSSGHVGPSNTPDEPPPSPPPPEDGDQQVSAGASHLSALPEKTPSPVDSSDSSPEDAPPGVEPGGVGVLMCEMEEPQGDSRPFFTADDPPNLLLGAWYSSRYHPATPKHLLTV